jgi:flavin-dependent dehydrogenase
MKSPGYMLDRSLFDKELVTSAISAGARLSTGTKAIGLSSKGLWVEKDSKKEEIESKVIIGADGVHSLIARWAGLPSMKTIVALQYEVVNPHTQNHAEVFFHPDFEGGYAWFFPKGKAANVGLGIVPAKTPLLPSLLDQFLDRLVELKGPWDAAILGRTGGSVPCGGPRQTVLKNILLAGDAAGHAHPITGAGILNAVIGGEIAGRIAGEAILRGDLKYLQKYENEWHEAFGKSLTYGALKRQFLEENWKDAGIGFEGLIRKTWVGFKEYYKNRGKIPLDPPFSME